MMKPSLNYYQYVLIGVTEKNRRDILLALSQDRVRYEKSVLDFLQRGQLYPAKMMIPFLSWRFLREVLPKKIATTSQTICISLEHVLAMADSIEERYLEEDCQIDIPTLDQAILATICSGLPGIRR